MGRHITLGMTLVAGVAMGAVAVGALHAQAKPPVYAVIDISDITDPEGFKGVAQRGPDTHTMTIKMGGRYITRTANITALDGTAPKRLIVVAFESLEKAQAWYNSPGLKETNDIRAKTTKSRSFAFEGMPN
jgi:uncharacterized protein (DUF1330 family)